MAAVSNAPRAHGALDPVLMLLAVLAMAIALTWAIPSGLYQRLPLQNGVALVVPGSYRPLPKDRSPENLLQAPAREAGTALPAPLTAIATALPAGMKQSAGLIFMILFLGGMFGVLRASGALDAAIDRLVTRTGGRVAILVPVLMLAISAGSAFLGLISAYLLIIPVLLALSARLGLSALFGLAVVTVPAKIGYLASVANPVVLVVAQPSAGVPVFSGWWLRLAAWVVMLGLGICYVLWQARGQRTSEVVVVQAAAPLAPRQWAIVFSLAAAVGIIIYGSTALGWQDEACGAFYIVLGAVIAACAGMAPRATSKAFLEGMQAMLLAAALVGMAKAVEIVLADGAVLDTIVDALSRLAKDRPPLLVGQALLVIEAALTVVIPSTSAKAALSMPILAPIAQLSGVSRQTTVLAFLFGNGLMHLVSPTSGMLLAYLATGGISYGAWIRFILPLFLALAVLCLAIVAAAVMIGYA